MSLAQFIQDAWQQQAKWLVVLRPLSYLSRGVSLLNQKLISVQGLKPGLYRSRTCDGDW